jgi:hypothetical protein
MDACLCILKELWHEAYIVKRNELQGTWGNFADSRGKSTRILWIHDHCIDTNKHGCT